MLIASHNLLIIENKDYETDNYNVQRGLEYVDLAMVSAVYTEASADPQYKRSASTFYIGIDPTDFKIKWDWEIIDTSTGVSPICAYFKGNTEREGCRPYYYGTQWLLPSTYHYGASSIYLTGMPATAPFPTLADAYAPVIVNKRLGVRCLLPVFSNECSANFSGGVGTCLVLPATASDYLRTYNDFTLSGGPETVRFHNTSAGSIFITAWALNEASNISAYAVWQQDFVQLNAVLVSSVNEMDDWRMGVKAYAHPNQPIPPNWYLQWDFPDTDGFSRAYYLDDGSEYPVDLETLSAKCDYVTAYPSISGIEFHFDTPGVKKARVSVIESMPITPPPRNYASGIPKVIRTNRNDWNGDGVPTLSRVCNKIPPPAFNLGCITTDQNYNYTYLDSPYPINVNLRDYSFNGPDGSLMSADQMIAIMSEDPTKYKIEWEVYAPNLLDQQIFNLTQPNFLPPEYAGFENLANQMVADAKNNFYTRPQADFVPSNPTKQSTFFEPDGCTPPGNYTYRGQSYIAIPQPKVTYTPDGSQFNMGSYLNYCRYSVYVPANTFITDVNATEVDATIVDIYGYNSPKRLQGWATAAGLTYSTFGERIDPYEIPPVEWNLTCFNTLASAYFSNSDGTNGTLLGLWTATPPPTQFSSVWRQKTYTSLQVFQWLWSCPGYNLATNPFTYNPRRDNIPYKRTTVSDVYSASALNLYFNFKSTVLVRPYIKIIDPQYDFTYPVDTFTVESPWFNSTALDIVLDSYDYSDPNMSYIDLRVVAPYASGNKFTAMNESHAPLEWLWNSDSVSATLIRTGDEYGEGVDQPATLADLMEFRSDSIGIYYITASNIYDSSVYRWFNVKLTSVNVVGEFDECQYTNPRVIELTAFANYDNSPFLLTENDRYGQPIRLKWSWDSPDVALRSANGNWLRNGVEYNATDCNPAYALIISDARTLTPTLCTVSVSAFCSNVEGAASDKVNVDTFTYDILPDGFELDFMANHERASQLPDGMYRFVSGNTYDIMFTGLLRLDSRFPWLTGNEIIDAVGGANCFYYLNDDITTKVDGPVLLKTFDLGLSAVSSVTFETSCLQFTDAFAIPHKISRTLEIRLYQDNYIPSLSAYAYPEYVWLLPSTPPVSSLADNPEAYYTLNSPYPSAYGEGRTNDFLMSATQLPPSAYHSNFESYTWYLDDNGSAYQRDSGPSSPAVIDIASVMAAPDKQIGVTVAGFIGSMGLENRTLSTYKDDIDGTERIFKNWFSLSATPLIVTNYDDPTSVDINIDYDNIDREIFFNFETDIRFPNTSPVEVDRSTMLTLWTASGNNGDIFTELIRGDVPFVLPIDVYSNDITTLRVLASALLPIYIPDYSPYSFGYPKRYQEYIIPSLESGGKEFDVTIASILISSLDPYSLYGMDSDPITALRGCSVTGIALTQLTPVSYTWNVSGDIYTDVNWTSSFPTSTSPFYKAEDYPVVVIPVSLTVSSYDFTFTRERDLLVRCPPEPTWVIYPDSSRTAIGQPFKFINRSYSIMPLVSTFYQIEDEASTYEQKSGTDDYVVSFQTNGNKTLLVTAIDAKNFMHTERFDNIVFVLSAWETYSPFVDRPIEDRNSLLYSLADVSIAPNEWTTHIAVNNTLDRLYDNMIYLDYLSKYYRNPPSETLGWFADREDGSYGWNLYPNDDHLNVAKFGTTLSGLIAYVPMHDGYVCLGFSDRFEIWTDEYSPTKIMEKRFRTVNDPFINLTNIGIDSSGRIVAFDQGGFGLISVYEFNPDYEFNPLRLVVKWGGLGSERSKLKFRNALDMSVDDSGIVYVADTGNRVVKSYTSTGSWLRTFSSLKFNPSETEDHGSLPNGSVISVAADRNGDIYTLTNRYVVMFDSSGNEKASFDWAKLFEETFIPRRIVASYDDGMIYIVCESRILKFSANGYFIGSLGEVPDEFDTTIQGYKYVNAIHDYRRVLTVTTDKFILKFSDFIDYLKIKFETEPYWWSKSDIRVGTNEFVEYWVYNRIFARMWDNIEFFRKSLLGRVVLTLDSRGKTIYKTYTRDEVYKPQLPFAKEDIFIGINELVTPDVLNRCISKIYDCQNIILSMITSNNLRWRWIDTIAIGANPTRYSETVEGGTNEVKWGNALS